MAREHRVSPMTAGALAAAATPLGDGGRKLDEPAFQPYVEFLAEGGLDGIFALGTTGEGILLSVPERKRAAHLFLEASAGRLRVIVHCGAQTTADTVELAEHAAGLGADGVAVVAPPYYAFDEGALVEHFAAAADACAPTSFWLYEFAARSGYAIPIPVVERLRERAPNLAGLKVSDKPIERVEPYLLDGLAVLVGAEGLLLDAFERGAAGAVSGLAAAFPDSVARLVRERTPESLALVARLRESVERFPVNAALKTALAWRGVRVQPDVRAPLRPLSQDERRELERELEQILGG
jgi:dihydrodipicolinate synthase/N-acetylneuraminate lyase